MATKRENIALDQATKAMVERAANEWPASDDDEAIAKQFVEAESDINNYLAAVENRSATFPDAQELAWACYSALAFTDELQPGDAKFLARLYASSLGASMFEIAPKIRDIRNRAVQKLEKWKADSGEKPATMPDDELPF